MGFKSVVPFRGELSFNGQNWITLGGGRVTSQAGATIRSPAGRWSLLTVAADAAAAAKVEFYANGVKQFELTIPSAEGIVTNSVDFYDAAEGDEIAIVFVRNNAYSRTVRPTGSIQFETASGSGPVAFHQATRSNTYATGGGGSGSVSTLTFGQVYNSSSATALTQTPCSFQAAGTLSHLRLVRTSNSGNVAVVATVHINGAPTPITVSLASGFTGTIEDTTNTAEIAPGDVVTIVCVETTAGGTYTIDQACLRFTSTDGAYDLFNATVGQALTTSFVNNVWAAAGGGTSYGLATSGLVVPHAVEISDARVVIGPSGGSFVPTWGLYNGAWFDTFAVPDAAGITETKSTGQTRLGAGSRVALGIQSATGASSRGMGAMGLTLREAAQKTSYNNPGGKGDRTSLIVLRASAVLTASGSYPTIQNGYFLLDGRYQAGLGYWSSANWLLFDFGEPRLIDEATWFQSTAATHGVWRWQGWNGTSYEDIGPTFTLGGSANQIHTSLHGNTKAYSRYLLERVSGVPSNAPWLMGVDFRIDDNSQNPVKWTHPQGWGNRSTLVDFVASPAFLLGLPNAPIDGNIFNSSVPSLSITNGSWAWANATTNGVLTFDFGQPVTMQGIRLRMSGGQEQGTYVVEGSGDGSSYSSPIASFLWGGSASVQGVTSGLYNQAVEFTGNITPYRFYRIRQIAGVTNTTPWQQEITFRLGGEEVPPADISAGPGALILTGHQPIIQAATFVSPGAGSLLATGMPVEVHTETEIAVSAGYLLVTGQPVLASVGITATPGSGGLVIRGGEPLVYTVSGTASSQLAVLAIGEVIPYAQLSQLSVIAVAEPPPPPVMASQAAVMAIGEIVPDVCLSQAAVLVLGHQTDCVTSLCQIWKITRRDGKVYRYTSLDRDLVFGGKVYKACGSLDPSASDNSSVMGSVGSQTLTGIIRDDGISEAELFGGLFDDAYVTSDLVSFDDPTFVPRRLASGWIGQITQGRVVHSLEVVSIGARIEQQALVRVVSPTCSHKFGDAGCGLNVEAMKIPAEITRVMDRGLFYVSVVNPGDDARQWANGRVRFLDGVNAGVVREFKSIDFATGLLSLWALTGLAPAPGDKIEILPGCDLTREGGCTAYANIINFGGFPDVPGTDAVLETPNAKI